MQNAMIEELGHKANEWTADMEVLRQRAVAAEQQRDALAQGQQALKKERDGLKAEASAALQTAVLQKSRAQDDAQDHAEQNACVELHGGSGAAMGGP